MVCLNWHNSYPMGGGFTIQGGNEPIILVDAINKMVMVEKTVAGIKKNV